MSEVEELDTVIHALATVGVAMGEGDPEVWRAMAAGLAEAREAVLTTYHAGARREGILAMLMAAHRALPTHDARRHGWLLRAVTMRLETDDLPRGPELRARAGRLTDELARKAARADPVFGSASGYTATTQAF